MRPASRQFAGVTRFGLILLCIAALLPVAAAAESLRILSQNMNRLFDDVDDGNRERVLPADRFRARVLGAARTIADTHALPHIIALQEVENLNVLRAVALEIQRSHRVRYRQYLLPGHDISGINLGFLVRHEIEIRRFGQLFRERVFGAERQALFSRPPLYLEACYAGNCATLVNLHLRSMRGLDDARQRDRVARKRLHQAEAIATWIDRQQDAAPPPSLMLLGDFNALTPGDAHVDVIGIVRGDPDNRRARLRGRDLVDPDLLDLSARIPQQRRYSYIFRGRKQQLDYLFVNRDFGADLEQIAFGRIDYGLSDHAGLYAEFDW